MPGGQKLVWEVPPKSKKWGQSGLGGATKTKNVFLRAPQQLGNLGLTPKLSAKCAINDLSTVCINGNLQTINLS